MAESGVRAESGRPKSGVGRAGARSVRGGEGLAHDGLDDGGIEVAHGDDSEAFGAIPCVVKVGEERAVGGFEHGLDADGQSLGKNSAAIERFVAGDGGAVVTRNRGRVSRRG